MCSCDRRARSTHACEGEAMASLVRIYGRCRRRLGSAATQLLWRRRRLAAASQGVRASQRGAPSLLRFPWMQTTQHSIIVLLLSCSCTPAAALMKVLIARITEKYSAVSTVWTGLVNERATSQGGSLDRRHECICGGEPLPLNVARVRVSCFHGCTGPGPAPCLDADVPDRSLIRGRAAGRGLCDGEGRG
jgi:hypothetical protein